MRPPCSPGSMLTALVAVVLGILPLPARSDCIGLVLGGGGARGAAHVGVLKVLEREHIPICRIAGTSMGAIIGGLYAAGYRADDIENIMEQIDWKDVLSDNPPREKQSMRRKDDDLRFLLGYQIGYHNGRITAPQGIIQGQKLLLLLRAMLLQTWTIEKFDDLPIPYRAVAADILSGKPVIWSEGDLALAIRTSMSVPGAFAPIAVDDYLLVDGGIYDNVPVGVARSMGTDRLIVIDVGTPIAKREDLTTPLSILNQVVGTLSQDRINQELATLGPRDLLIRPELGDFRSADFNDVAKAAKIGFDAANSIVDKLRPFAADAATYAKFEQRHRLPDYTTPMVAFVHVNASSAGVTRLIERDMQVLIGKPLDSKAVDAVIGEAYGLGRFQSIRYTIVEDKGQTGIEVSATDNGWGPNVAEFGFQLSNDFAGHSDYQIKVDVVSQNLNDYGGEWRNRFRLGGVTGVQTELYQPFGFGSHFYAQGQASYYAENFPVYDVADEVAEYRVKRGEALAEIGYYPSNTVSLSTALHFGRDSAERVVGLPGVFPDGISNFGSSLLTLKYDTLDDAVFPSSGARLDANSEFFRKALGSDDSADIYRIVWDGAVSSGANHFLFGTRLTYASKDTSLLEANDTLGGFLNLSGYPERALIGSEIAYGRAVYYRQLTDRNALFAVPIFVGGSAEAGNVWSRQSAISLDSLIFAGSLFAGVSSPFGPIFLGYGRTSNGHGSIYLTFGTLIRPRF
jgi:NTE family protein